VLIGVSLAHYGIRGALRGALLLSFVKLVVQPLAVLAFAHGVLGLGGVPLAIVVLMAALPVGSNALIFAQRYETLAAETSAAIVVSTLAFVASAPLWLAVLHAVT
jgi:predicted permease